MKRKLRIFRIDEKEYVFNEVAFNNYFKLGRETHGRVYSNNKRKLLSIGAYMEEIAESIGVSSDTVKRWRSGRNGPVDMEMIKAIANYLNIEYLKLLKEKDDETMNSENYISDVDCKAREAAIILFERFCEVVTDYQVKYGYDNRVLEEIYSNIGKYYDDNQKFEEVFNYYDPKTGLKTLYDHSYMLAEIRKSAVYLPMESVTYLQNILESIYDNCSNIGIGVSGYIMREVGCSTNWNEEPEYIEFLGNNAEFADSPSIYKSYIEYKADMLYQEIYEVFKNVFAR